MNRRKTALAIALTTAATACLTVIDLRSDASAYIPKRPAPVVATVEEPALPSEGVSRSSVIGSDVTEAEHAEPETTDLGTFKLTAYCPCPACCGEWADGITYTGTAATQGRTLAVDPDVIPLGSSVEIDGQTYVAEDIGGAIQGNRIDVYFRSHTDALEFGVQYATVTLNAAK